MVFCRLLFLQDALLLCCPITQEVMEDPVICVGDGHTYERQSIEEWFRTSSKSPSTGRSLGSNEKILVPNHSVRQAISFIQAEGHKK